MALSAAVPLELADRSLITARPAWIMGILNLTPDSFWQKNRKIFLSEAVDFTLKMLEEGADIIDMGAESSRPGAAYVSEAEELERLVPVIREIRKQTNCPISIDTRKKNVFEQAYDCGADILNDISALEDDADLAPFCSGKKVPVILMHKRGIPAIMQNNTAYGNVAAEVCSYLSARKKYALDCGIREDKIIVDPGIGFGKDARSNATLVCSSGEIAQKTGSPVLIGLSRKSLFNFCGSPEERLYATVTANVLAVQSGATFLRVHDVRPAADMLKTLQLMGEGR